MTRHSRQTGLIPGAVIEINIALAALIMALALFSIWAGWPFKPVPLDTMPTGWVVAAADNMAAVPAGWAVMPSEDGATTIRHAERVLLQWVILLLLVATVASLFVWYFSPPFWVLAAALFGACAYSVYAGPLHQWVTVAADGTVTMGATPRLAGILISKEIVPAKQLENVWVHNERAEVRAAFRKRDSRYGWRIYTDTQANARVLAALLQAKVKPGFGVKPNAGPDTKPAAK